MGLDPRGKASPSSESVNAVMHARYLVNGPLPRLLENGCMKQYTTRRILGLQKADVQMQPERGGKLQFQAAKSKCFTLHGGAFKYTK